MKGLLRTLFSATANDDARTDWLKATLTDIPDGLRILDAGAGELRNKPLCRHLQYVAQDFGKYEGKGDGSGLQTGSWRADRVDIVSDITSIPEPDGSFDAILCSEVFEHLPDALPALDEFARLLRPGGKLIITAPFASMSHFAPYHFATGYSRYWFEHHLPARGLRIDSLVPNGDWFAFLRQELLRLPGTARRYGEWSWPLAYVAVGLALTYFMIRGGGRPADDLACFGWQCIAIKG